METGHGGAVQRKTISPSSNQRPWEDDLTVEVDVRDAIRNGVDELRRGPRIDHLCKSERRSMQ